MSVIGAVFALSAMLGPVLGGWFTDGLGWRWAFWVNLPLGAAAIASGAAFLPSAPRRVRPVRIAVAGIVAVTAIVLMASWGGVAYRWGSPVIVSISVIAVLASAVEDRKSDTPPNTPPEPPHLVQSSCVDLSGPRVSAAMTILPGRNGCLPMDQLPLYRRKN
jgi:MFS family permease